jgi:hypothetical protein
MNSEKEFLYPEWQIPVQDLILETDRAKLPEKMRAAEAKISERLHQIGQSTGGRHEQDAMNRASTLISAISLERLAG